MTKNEYKAVCVIQGVCYELYENTNVQYRRALRTIMSTLAKDFYSKYNGTIVFVQMNNEVYRTSILKYNLTYIDCSFDTGIGWGRYFDPKTMIVGY